jgi:hypothetical protein
VTTTHAVRLSPRTWRAAIVAGIVIGVVYALSPLTVWFFVAMAVMLRCAINGLEGTERRWVLALLLVAIVLRVAAVGGLFAMTNHNAVPFNSIFGDEEYFIKRSIWLRNVALGIPIHSADLIYAFDEYSATSYLYVLAFVQVLVGPAPYGAHLLGMALFLSGSVILFRTVRSTLGRMPAAIGLVLMLFLPSLFAWSISALKDPLYFSLTACGVAMTIRLVRAPHWVSRVLALATLLLLTAILESIRAGGAALTAAGIATGLAVAYLAPRPRWILACVFVAPIAAGAALSRPDAQVRTYTAVENAAKQHWGHVATPGYVYTTLDDRFYPDKSEIGDMHLDEGIRFIVRSMERYITAPLPWEIQSTAALAYLPEQLVWYLLVALAPFGLMGALRRDTLTAGVLFGHALVAAVTIALISGNVGTLIRHRGFALPYFLWLSAVGACDLMTRRSAQLEHPC